MGAVQADQLGLLLKHTSSSRVQDGMTEAEVGALIENGALPAAGLPPEFAPLAASDTLAYVLYEHLAALLPANTTLDPLFIVQLGRLLMPSPGADNVSGILHHIRLQNPNADGGVRGFLDTYGRQGELRRATVYTPFLRIARLAELAGVWKPRDAPDKSSLDLAQVIQGIGKYLDKLTKPPDIPELTLRAAATSLTVQRQRAQMHDVIVPCAPLHRPRPPRRTKSAGIPFLQRLNVHTLICAPDISKAAARSHCLLHVSHGTIQAPTASVTSVLCAYVA